MDSRQSDQLQHTISQGARWLQQGDVGRAEKCFSGILSEFPAESNALHLMGIVAQKRNRLSAAENYFRRSLKVNWSQPEALNNLANLISGMGRWDEAISLYEAAVRAAPDFASGWFNLGLAHQTQGEHTVAIEAFNKARLAKPGDPRFSNAIGISYKELDRLDDAIEAFDQALVNEPDHVRSLHNKGAVLRLKEEPLSAIECYKSALKINTEMPHLHFNYACALHDVGQIDDACRELRIAISLRPDYLEAHETLNKLYWETENTDLFCKSYLDAIERSPQIAELRAEYARMLEWAERFDEAEDVLRQSIRQIGDHADLHHGLAKATGRRGETGTSLSHFAKAIETAGDKQTIRIDVSRYLIKLGAYEEALAHLNVVEQLNPLDQEMWAYRGLCWRYLGDERDAWLNDYDRFVQVRRLETPEGYDDLEHFMGELRRVLIGMHDKVTQPIDQSLRGGTQTAGRLIHKPVKEIQEFRQALKKQIDDFLAGLPEDPTHPFLGRLTGDSRFSGSWSVRLKSKGYHVNHVHPAGWLSGPTYIEVPSVIRDDDETRGGWVKFGETGLDLGPEREEVRIAVKPEVGMCAFFPSYVWHGTYPFISDEYRMTAPMDCVPV